MSRIAAKYGIATNGTGVDTYKAGEVTDRAYGDVFKPNFAVNEDLAKGLGITIPLPTRPFMKKNPKAFRVHLNHAVHDVHGLKEYGHEHEDFRTSRIVKRSVALEFDDVATANRAFNHVLNIDGDTLKSLIESETLQDLLAEDLSLHVVSPKSMKPMNSWQRAFAIPS